MVDLHQPSFCLHVKRIQEANGDFDLWSCQTEDFPAAILENPHASGLLDESELEHCARFRLNAPRQQFLTARVLTRTVLSQYADVPPEDWRFVKNAFGRPEISPDLRARIAPNVSPGPLLFNLSHAGCLSLLIVSTSGSVGVDVEDVMQQLTPLGVVSEVLSKTELARLMDLPEPDRPAEFLRYWVLKEALSKARGFGLNVHMPGIVFSGIESGCIRVSLRKDASDLSGEWHFTTMRIFDRFLAATAYERHEPRSEPGPDLPQAVC